MHGKRKIVDMNLKYYSTVDEIENQIKSEILPTQIVVDIGCGIYPINYFVPSVHILVEPWGEYIEVLESRYKEDSRNIILKSDGVQALRIFNNKSVDSIFVIDVIEHMSKLEGNAKIVRIEGNEWHTQSKYFASRMAISWPISATPWTRPRTAPSITVRSARPMRLSLRVVI